MQAIPDCAVAHIYCPQNSTHARIQPLSEHLRKVANLTAAHAAKAGLQHAGFISGMLHDFGKYSIEFQNYILSACGYIKPDEPGYTDPVAAKGKINHSFAGGQLLWKNLQGNPKKQAVAQLIAMCVLSHHCGLKDCATPDCKDLFTESYMVRSEEKAHCLQCENECDPDILSEIKKNISDNLVLEVCRFLINLQKRIMARLPSNATDSDKLDFENSRDFQQGLLVRFLFSCLIDADRTDSANFEDPQWVAIRATMPRQTWNKLVKRIENYLALKKPEHAIDHIRGEISAHCATRAMETPGLFSLTVPTGGGKTLASLRFALLHAQKHQMDRVIYVIPYTSIIDQNADVARKILEEDEIPGSIVLEHHSNFLPDTESEDEDAAKQWEKLSDNWDAPVVFTTMVQFLESLFGSGTRSARRMHNLARSVIVFDEVQTVPVRCLRMFCNAVDFLTGQCGSTAVLCTATQPSLGNLPRPFLGRLGLKPEMEIVPDVPRLFSNLKRTAFFDHCHTSMTPEDVAELAHNEQQNHGSCLVVCNTKKLAEHIFALCTQHSGLTLYYLSTNLCPSHRMEKLNSMRDDLENGRPVLCVSTQLIECGVDISFRSVIRMAAGLDSILQAAGRCNRHGESTLGRVHVVRIDSDLENLECLKDIKEGRNVFLETIRVKFAKELEASAYDLTLPQFISTYFDHYFYRRGDVLSYATKDSNTLLDMLGSNHLIAQKGRFPMLGQSFCTAAQLFKSIDSIAKSIIVPYNEGASIIADLCSTDLLSNKYNRLRKAQRFSVNIFPNVERILMQNDALYPIQDSGMFALRPNFYSTEHGVITQPLQHLGLIHK